MYTPQQRSAETENEDAISVRYKANHLYDMASHLYDIANHLTSRMSTPRPFCCSSGWTEEMKGLSVAYRKACKGLH
jgi:hypothetical protein